MTASYGPTDLVYEYVYVSLYVCLSLSEDLYALSETAIARL